LKQLTYNRPFLAILIAGIGDLVLASPALRALKNGHPHSPLHLLTSLEASELAVNYPYIEKVWSFPIRQLRRTLSVYLDIFSLLVRLRRIRFHKIVNLYHVDSPPGALKMGALFSAIRSNEKIGHDRYGMGLVLHGKLPCDFYVNRHLADTMIEIARLAGGIADSGVTEVFWDKEAVGRCHDIFDETSSSLKQHEKRFFIGINPGGDRTNRRWAPERYAKVGDRITAVLPTRLFIFGGPGEEEIAHRIQGQMKSEVVNLAGKLSISDLAYVISRLDLLITNDSGPMHMAAAAHTPVVAIFGPEDPLLMGPYTSPDLYRVIHKPLPCRPCQKDRCARPLCLEAITPDEVFTAALELIKERGA